MGTYAASGFVCWQSVHVNTPEAFSAARARLATAAALWLG
jgi:hypothetical protein